MSVASTAVPYDLLSAVAERRGRIALVVGAGCSLESPTSLHLASVYSERAFKRLQRDGLLEDGDCDPSDLSAVASAVFAKEGKQAPLVNVLPREEYAHARPNLGHLLAIALVAEDAIAWIATLNFDMALSNAITDLHVTQIATVSGPDDLGRFGDKALVYLHRNAYETDVERWILRREAIEEQWSVGWEGIVSERIASAPHLVFAGLGSRAAALTESVERVQRRAPAQTRTYLVDPASTSAFAGQLRFASEKDHIQLPWGEFMDTLADRLSAELDAELGEACAQVAESHSWDDGTTTPAVIRQALRRLTLCELGMTRAQWLGIGAGGYAPEVPSTRSYVPDDANSRQYMADLVLGLGALLESADCSVEITSGGVVRLESPSNAGAGSLSVYPVSGRGLAPWSVVDRIERRCASVGPQSADVVLVSALRSVRPEAPAAPIDILGPVPDGDITYGVSSTRIVSVDELRFDVELRRKLAR